MQKVGMRKEGYGPEGLNEGWPEIEARRDRLWARSAILWMMEAQGGDTHPTERVWDRVQLALMAATTMEQKGGEAGLLEPAQLDTLREHTQGWTPAKWAIVSGLHSTQEEWEEIKRAEEMIGRWEREEEWGPEEVVGEKGEEKKEDKTKKEGEDEKSDQGPCMLHE